MATTDLRHDGVNAGPVPPAVPSNRRPDIQGLRAVAVLLVVVYHAGLPVPGGFVGVDVFFVISGFVITAMLLREWGTTGRVGFRHFYFRRFLRLTPALALTVTLVAAASIILQNPFGAQQTTARTGLGAMLLSANFAIGHAAGDYFADNAATNPLLNTWSLSVEEQFYLVFPALFVLGWTLSRRWRRRLLPPVAIVAAIAVASFVLSLALSFGWTAGSAVTDYFGGPETFAFYSPFTRAWEFAVGALLALLITHLQPRGRALAHLMGWSGAALLAVAAFAIRDTMVFPGVVVLVPVVGTSLLLLAGSGWTTGVSRALATRPAVAIGDLSYSWYLWHWPVIVFTALLFPHSPVALVVAAVISLAPAIASYRLLEQPLRRLRPHTRPRAIALVMTTLLIPIAMATTLLLGANAGWGLVPALPVTAPATTTPGSAPSTGDGAPLPDTAVADAPAADDADAVADGEVAGGEGGSLRSQHIAVRAGCVNVDLDPRACRFGPAAPAPFVLLAGDSQAYALADGVAAAAERLGLGTIVTSHTGCPFLARESSGVHNYPCRSWQQSIVDYALAEHPAAVVIANRSAGYVHPEWQWRTAQTDGGARADSVDEAAAAWRAGLEPVVANLAEAGIPVVLIAAVPEMPGYTDGTSLLSQAFGARDFEVPRQDVVAARRPVDDIEAALADRYSGVSIYDPIPVLCDDEVCAATRDGQVRYQDETHLSVPGSLMLVDGLTATLGSATGTSPTTAAASAS